jgi:predicted RNA-binding Zn ribbon-like protein
MAHYSYPSTEGLEVVRRFVNTVHYERDEVEEELHTPDDLATFLRDAGLADKGVTARSVDLRRALEVREALRALMAANNGESLSRDAVEILNRAAARSRVVAAFDDHASWRIEPASEGVDNALGRMLATVFRSMGDGTWSRMKACGNPDCRWAFYDATKNRAGRWCEMASCGNRMKARAFRERARAQRAGRTRSA